MKMKSTVPFHFTGCLATCGAVLALAANASAGDRRFAYSYETTTMAAGTMEFETWATFKTDKSTDPDFNRFDIRHEFEYGMTDRLQLALYLDWRWEENKRNGGSSMFRDLAVEAIYGLTNPNTSAFGSALYGEVKGSGDFIEVEGKLLLQKNIGPWVIVYNIGGEVVWENNYEDDEAELMQSLGVSYSVNPSLAVGFEALHEVAVPEVEHLTDQGVYVGPNLTWRKGGFGATTAALWQLTDLDGEPDFQVRAIFSFSF